MLFFQNAQIRKDVANILKGADLEVITMKAVCMKVYSLYPDFDLSDKKAFIKETVKAVRILLTILIATLGSGTFCNNGIDMALPSLKRKY